MKEGNGRPITDAHSWVNHVTGWQHDAHFHCPVSPCGFFQTLTLCCPLSYRLIFLLPRFPGAQFPSPIFYAFFSNALFNVAVTSVAHFSGWHYFHCPFSVAVISDIYFLLLLFLPCHFLLPNFTIVQFSAAFCLLPFCHALSSKDTKRARSCRHSLSSWPVCPAAPAWTHRNPPAAELRGLQQQRRLTLTFPALLLASNLYTQNLLSYVLHTVYSMHVSFYVFIVYVMFNVAVYKTVIITTATSEKKLSLMLLILVIIKDIYIVQVRKGHKCAMSAEMAVWLRNCLCLFSYLHTHTHTRLTALFPGLPGWAGTRKVKPIWILLKQETVSGSGISWDICKSATRSRQITMPATHHSVFYRPDALPAAQPTASKH